MFEEKKLVRSIADFESSLPYAQPLQELDEKFAGIKQDKKQLSAVLKKNLETRDRYRQEEKDLKDHLNKTREQREKINDDKVPAVEKIRDEYKNKIKEIKAQKTGFG